MILARGKQTGIEIELPMATKQLAKAIGTAVGSTTRDAGKLVDWTAKCLRGTFADRPDLAARGLIDGMERAARISDAEPELYKWIVTEVAKRLAAPGERSDVAGEKTPTSNPSPLTPTEGRRRP